MYVVSDEAADEMANILMTKTFLSKQEAVKVSQCMPSHLVLRFLSCVFMSVVLSRVPFLTMSVWFCLAYLSRV